LINYNNKKFRCISTSENGEVSSDTIFIYQQNNDIITSSYIGRHILEGHLLGTVDTSGVINMCYHQINTKKELMTGSCISTPEILENGKIRLHEEWQWTSGDKSNGNSILEEL